MAINDGQAANTDRTLWTSPEGHRVFVTREGGLGLDVSGHCIVKPVGNWHVLGAPFKCKAREAPQPSEPQDCDWPVCGCDPHAEKVITALEEASLLVDGHQELVDKAADKAGDLGDDGLLLSLPDDETTRIE